MLDYLAVDYPGAVQDGKIVDQAEYDEQIDFATTVRAQIAGLPARPQRAALETDAAALLDAIRGKRPPPEIAAMAGALRGRIIGLYEVRVAPRQAPDMRAAPADYAVRTRRRARGVRRRLSGSAPAVSPRSRACPPPRRARHP